MEASRDNVKNSVKFIASDMPEANDLTIHTMVAFAEHEASLISQRTKDALAIAKKRDVVLGTAGSANLKPNIKSRQETAMASAEKL